MKSLQESLFDKDLVTSDITLGHYYKHVLKQSHMRDKMTKFINKYFKSSKLLKDTGKSDSYEALLKIILSFPVSQQSSIDFKNALRECLRKNYLKSGYDPIIAFSFETKTWEYRDYVDNILSDNIHKMMISFNQFVFVFERK